MHTEHALEGFVVKTGNDVCELMTLPQFRFGPCPVRMLSMFNMAIEASRLSNVYIEGSFSKKIRFFSFFLRFFRISPFYSGMDDASFFRFFFDSVRSTYAFSPQQATVLREDLPGFVFESNRATKHTFTAETSLGADFTPGWSGKRSKNFQSKSEIIKLKVRLHLAF